MLNERDLQLQTGICDNGRLSECRDHGVFILVQFIEGTEQDDQRGKHDDPRDDRGADDAPAAGVILDGGCFHRRDFLSTVLLLAGTDPV